MGERVRRSPRFEDEGGAVIIMWEKRRKVEVKSRVLGALEGVVADFCFSAPH